MNYIEVYFNDVLKHSFPINADILSIGRAPGNEVIIDNLGVSTHHAVITKQNGAYYIEDLNSTNGTFINSQKISSQQQISFQDSIIIGKHKLKFSEWGQSYEQASPSLNMEANEATIMMHKKDVSSVSKANKNTQQNKQYYLIIKGEYNGINKLLLTSNSYGIGKAKVNDIRLGGWFTAAYIAEIEKIGHFFYLTPLKKNKVKLNDTIINTSTLLSPTDKIKIKNLFIRFLTD